MVAPDRGVPPHRHHQRRQRRHQPTDQARSPQRLRVPQPGQPTPTITLREHPRGPPTSQARLTSETPFGLMRETSLSRDAVEAAAERLKRAGLLESLVDDEQGYESWRVSEAALAAAATGTDAARSA